MCGFCYPVAVVVESRPRMPKEEPGELARGWAGMAYLRQFSLILLLAVLLPVPSPAKSGSCVFLAAGTGIEQQPFEEDPLHSGEFVARVGIFRALPAQLEAGLEAGYLNLGRFSYGYCNETGAPDCELLGERLDALDLLASLRWRPRVGPVRPYFAAGGGVSAIKGGKYSEGEAYTKGALLREIRGEISTAVGLHVARVPGLGVEVRWLAILDSTGQPWNRNTDVLRRRSELANTSQQRQSWFNKLISDYRRMSARFLRRAAMA
jgi:hypothetical protein